PRVLVEINAVAQFPERLENASAVAAAQGVGKARNGDSTIGVDIVPGVGSARAEGDIAPLRAAIKAQVVVVTRSSRGAVVDVEARMAVPGQNAHAPIADQRIGPDKHAASRAV